MRSNGDDSKLGIGGGCVKTPSIIWCLSYLVSEEVRLPCFFISLSHIRIPLCFIHFPKIKLGFCFIQFPYYFQLHSSPCCCFSSFDELLLCCYCGPNHYQDLTHTQHLPATQNSLSYWPKTSSLHCAIFIQQGLQFAIPRQTEKEPQKSHS